MESVIRVIRIYSCNSWTKMDEKMTPKTVTACKPKSYRFRLWRQLAQTSANERERARFGDQWFPFVPYGSPTWSYGPLRSVLVPKVSPASVNQSRRIAIRRFQVGELVDTAHS